jgi:hypothetical protein
MNAANFLDFLMVVSLDDPLLRASHRNRSARSGDSISFTIDVKFQENEMKLNYKGKVNGDTIKFTVEGPNGMTLEYDAKRVV